MIPSKSLKIVNSEKDFRGLKIKLAELLLVDFILKAVMNDLPVKGERTTCQSGLHW